MTCCTLWKTTRLSASLSLSSDGEARQEGKQQETEAQGECSGTIYTSSSPPTTSSPPLPSLLHCLIYACPLPPLLQLETFLQMLAADRALRTNPDVIEFLQPNGGGQLQGVAFVRESSLVVT